MNKEWSNLNKEFQTLISKKTTFSKGINKIFELRKNIYDKVMTVYNEFPLEGYCKQPFVNNPGYDSKTMAYSIYHIIRIEDIVLSRLLKKEEEIYIRNNYQKKMNSSIRTTGNELIGSEIEMFSRNLDIKELMNYFTDVYKESNEYIKGLEFNTLKNIIDEHKITYLLESGSVSHSEEAIWLIDYWCSKDVLGLLKMPFSRHWIMHVEAFLRIKNKLVSTAKK